jgi:myosin heavy subunit
VNSFEQLCINYANERLQYYFNMHIFRMEQEEYTKEGINWSKIEFLDNQPTIDLISKKPIGLMLLLDDESNFSKSTDMTILGKFQQSHSDCKVFLKGRNQTSFGIHHYAGDVNYQIEGFLEKNRDTLRQDLQELLASSKDDLIVKWFTQTPEEIVTDGVSTVSSVASRVSSSSTGQRKSAKSLTTGYQFTVRCLYDLKCKFYTFLVIVE